MSARDFLDWWAAHGDSAFGLSAAVLILTGVVLSGLIGLAREIRGRR